MTYNPDRRSNQDSAYLSAEIGKLVDQTVAAKAIAAQISEFVTTERPEYDVPLLTRPVTVGLIDELDDLPLSNIETGSVRIVPEKYAGATEVSSEMLADMDPSIQEQIALTLSQQIIDSLDAAVLGNATAVGTSTRFVNGLLSLASTDVDTGPVGTITNLDNFVKAIYAAQNATVPANPTLFLVNPATAQALSLIKVGTGYVSPLLDFQQDGSIVVAGRKLLVSKHVDALTQFWAITPSQSRLVLRQGTLVTKTYVPQNDSWFISATARWGWANLAPASVIRGYDAA